MASHEIQSIHRDLIIDNTKWEKEMTQFKQEYNTETICRRDSISNM